MATPVLMPRQGQSVESCILVDWTVAPGDKVEEGQILGNYETDKASFELESPAAGTVIELFYEDGDDIPCLTNIAAIGEPGEDVSALKDAVPEGVAAPAEEAAPADEPAPAQAAAPVAAASAAQAVGVSPRARNRAVKEGVAVDGLAGTGPGGRVIERDIVKAAAEGPRMSPAAKDAMAAGSLAAPATGSGPGGMVLSGDLKAPGAPAAVAPATQPGTTEEIPVTGIRKIIAERMKGSLDGTAQLTLNRSFNATSIQAYRSSVKKHADAMGLPNITINDIIAYATIRTLQKYPAMNAHWLGNKIVQYGSVNLGVAMDTPRGLMVPVVHGSEQFSLAQLSSAIKPIVQDAQSGSVNPDLLTGGTFTITNMGMLGIESFTPILNAPEVGILGVGGITLKPIMQDGEVKHVQAINLSLTVDHQAVDGGDGARFLKDLAKTLENFELALAQ